MKYFKLLFILFFHAAVFGQKTSLNTTKPIDLIANSKNIDRLNNVAYNIFLAFPDSAHVLARNALLLAENLNDSVGKGRSFLNLGVIYWSQSYYPVSLFYLKSALAYMPRNNKLYVSDIFKTIGRTYAELKDFKQAQLCLDSALLYCGNDVGRKAGVFDQRSHIYNKLKIFDKALAAALYSLKLNRQVHSDRNIAVLYGRIASIYDDQNMLAPALAYNDTTLLLSVKAKNRRLEAYTYLEYALIYNKMQRYDEAIKMAWLAIKLAGNIGIMEAVNKSYFALVNSYELKNDLKAAVFYQKRFNFIRDSLNNENRLKTVTLVQNYYDLNAKMNKIKEMQADDQINKTKINSQQVIIEIMTVSMVILSLMLFTTYYFYKQKEEFSNKLQYQHEELLDQKKLFEVQALNLQQVNGLKDKLLAVIGHDLRAPISTLSNIVELFENGYLSANEVSELMKDINPLVKGAELTLSNLVDWAGSQIKGRNIHTTSVDVFLLGVEMEQTFAHTLQLKSITFNNKTFPGQRVFADENHLKVILRNLVSNAIKFTDYNGTIILTTQVNNNDLIISIEDNGKGMSQAEMDKLFFLKSHFSNYGTSGEKGTGIGLLLCKELVELNGGKLQVSSEVGKGSVFYFNMPVVNAYA